MAFKKVQVGVEEIFTTTIQDIDGRKVEKWVVLKRDFPEVVKILNKKYGLNMRIKTERKEKDLDWAIR